MQFILDPNRGIYSSLSLFTFSGDGGGGAIKLVAGATVVCDGKRRGR